MSMGIVSLRRVLHWIGGLFLLAFGVSFAAWPLLHTLLTWDLQHRGVLVDGVVLSHRVITAKSGQTCYRARVEAQVGGSIYRSTQEMSELPDIGARVRLRCSSLYPGFAARADERVDWRERSLVAMALQAAAGVWIVVAALRALRKGPCACQ